MKINLTPGEPYDFQVDDVLYEEPYSYDSFSEVRVPWQHCVEFDGVVRTTKDFRSYVRGLKDEAKRNRDAVERIARKADSLEDTIRDRDTHILFLRNRVTDLETELNPEGDPEFLGNTDHDSPEGKDIRLRNQRREILRQREVIEDITHQRFVAQESLRQKTEEVHRLYRANTEQGERVEEAESRARLAEVALEDSRNHGRLYRLGAEPQPLQSPTSGMTVFGVDYDEAYKRVMDFPDVQRKIQITNSNNVMLEHRDEARRREIAQLQEALRKKNEIIKAIREKVAEARIYE